MNKQLILTPELIKRAEELDKQLCSIGLAIENRLGEVVNYFWLKPEASTIVVDRVHPL